MKINHVYKGDALEVIKTFPDESINCVITSPPYWQLRDYGFDGQWGLEKTYQEYLENLWSLMDEVKRVLTKNGTVWINLGDTYGTISGGTRIGTDGLGNKGSQKFTQPKTIPKCLLLIPHRFAIGCIDRGWIIRNDIIWAKPNAMPESVTDRFSKKHEYIFFMVKNQKYYFDLDRIKDKTITKDNSNRDRDNTKLNNTPGRTKMGGLKTNDYDFKNPGSVSDFWEVSTKSNSDDHYASFNTNLIDKPIIAGCPKGGIILDPFCGTGTTLYRAKILERKVIGIDGNKTYCKLAQNKINALPDNSIFNYDE